MVAHIMKKIVLDTNILMAVLELKIDIFTEIQKALDYPYELFVLDRTLDELEKFIKGSLLSKKQAAQFAKKLIASQKIRILQTEDPRPVDDILLDLEDFIVATVDKELKQALIKKSVPVLTIRQRKYVVIV
tara:strand:- start:352 stop:744 length:393 start_codon:yes stop_codon:yes gene_type:complete